MLIQKLIWMGLIDSSQNVSDPSIHIYVDSHTVPEHQRSLFFVLRPLPALQLILISRPFGLRRRKDVVHMAHALMCRGTPKKPRDSNIIIYSSQYNYTYVGDLRQITMETQPAAMEKLVHVCVPAPFSSSISKGLCTRLTQKVLARTYLRGYNRNNYYICTTTFELFQDDKWMHLTQQT